MDDLIRFLVGGSRPTPGHYLPFGGCNCLSTPWPPLGPLRLDGPLIKCLNCAGFLVGKELLLSFYMLRPSARSDCPDLETMPGLGHRRPRRCFMFGPHRRPGLFARGNLLKFFCHLLVNLSPHSIRRLLLHSHLKLLRSHRPLELHGLQICETRNVPLFGCLEGHTDSQAHLARQPCPRGPYNHRGGLRIEYSVLAAGHH